MKRANRHQGGFSLMEILVALGLLGGFSLLMMGLLFRPQQWVEGSAEQVESRANAVLNQQKIREHFSRSFPLRRKFFDCDESGGTDPFYQVMQGTGVIPITADNNTGFTLVTSVINTFAGVVSKANLKFHVPTPVPAGSYVLLSSINWPSYGMVFRASAYDTDTHVVTLSDAAADVQVPAEFHCIANHNNNTVTGKPYLESASATFLDDTNTANLIFGEASSVFRIDILRFASYYRTPGRKGQESLRVKEWPVPGQTDSILETEISQAIIQVRFMNAKWIPEAGDPTNGLFTADIGLVSPNLPLTQSTRDLANAPRKTMSTRITYTTQTGGVVNYAGVNPPAVMNRKHPSCSIVVTSALDAITYSNDNFGNWYQVTGQISEPVYGGISVVLAGGWPLPRCWHPADLTPAGSGHPLLADIANAMEDQIPLNPDASNALPTYYCDLRPGATLEGQLTYLDDLALEVKTIPCTGSTPPIADPLEYQYSSSAAATSCTSDGVINLGDLIVSGTTQSGPSLYLADDSCDFAGGGGNNQKCSTTDKGDLTKVRLMPRGIPAAGSPPSGTQYVQDLNCPTP